jgi:hypothetical protein
MPYFTERKTPTIGIEIEGVYGHGNHGLGELRDRLIRDGFDWVIVKREYTPDINAEIITPPMPWDYEPAQKDLERLMATLEVFGLRVGRKNSSCHVNMGARWIDSDETTLASYWDAAKANFSAANDRVGADSSFPRVGSEFSDPMPLVLVQDIVYRYAKHQHTISSMLAPSRRSRVDQAYATPLGRDLMDSVYETTSVDAIATLIGHSGRHPRFGDSPKMNALALHKWSNGLIEFRQHDSTLNFNRLSSWVNLLIAMVRHSDKTRIQTGGVATTYYAPDLISTQRPNSRLNIAYRLMRQSGGATVRQIMDATGCQPQRIRVMVTEIRQRLDQDLGQGIGQAMVLTHTQQHYGHAYGSSNGEHDLNGYEIQHQVDDQATDGLLPDDQRGGDAIWHGLDDDSFEILQDKIADFANR